MSVRQLVLDIERLPGKFEGTFWSRVQVTPACWEWTAGKQSAGYGVFWLDSKTPVLAHRLSYEIHNGPIREGLIVRHGCDNPACVNPDHLVVGLHADNMRDMVQRGRSSTGERNGQAKLTDAEVAEIRGAQGRQRDIGARFGVSQAQVSRIKNNINRRAAA